MKQKLTELAVTRLRPPRSGRLEVWDSTLPAFGLRITASGAKSYVIAIRKPSVKHPSRIKIGKPATMTLADARNRARELMAKPESIASRNKSDDPPEIPAETFAALAEQFLAHGRSKRGRPLRPSTTKEYRRALLLHAIALHERTVVNIRRADAADLIRHVATTSGPTSAMRTRAAGSRFYSWLIANGKVEHNPFTGTEGYNVAERARVLTDSEIAAMWTATEERHDFNLIVRLCLWTGCRRSEAGSMRWSELQDGLWIVPGSRTKNHRPLVLPLPRQAQDALAGHPRWVGRDLVFGRGPNGFMAWSKSKERLDARLAFAQSWDLHDLRRTVQTRLLALGVNRDLVNRLLNHALLPIDAAYDQHGYMVEKTAALAAWSRELERIIGRAEVKVVALPMRAS